MRVSDCIQCVDFPCQDVAKDCHKIPDAEIECSNIKTFMISEAPPQDPTQYFYAQNHPFYFQTTAQAFRDAGINVTSMQDVIDLGVYVTTAIKCGKTAYSISPKTVDNCTSILEKEIGLFPDLKSILLMGDTAIKSMNCIAKRETGNRIVPSGSTYKIRKGQYVYKKIRVYPSYLQTGKSYLIEKTKRKTIAEDIKAALKSR